MNTLSSHVLDTTAGCPAAGIPITLTTPDGQSYEGMTDDDGRCKDWGQPTLDAGIYHLRFHCHGYLSTRHGNSFYPYVDIAFELADNGGHYHVPLLISPFGFSSYRGS
ncbi:hydroxyisourate hydrolase [Alteromonas aestuariivivens]|uniref:5-hydroxyisourate hydrolase n=1 Tax=Alteromonas aestuariivivens TaxID=1938339 RepID=A0A3D8MBN6_9ALTE|nr:hydroxyisourate hydrolase [Alteromonas aestuariivivens]RDV27541.1 hydroxyisourate hydrolase [Alteromonas aestuariivivens]